tara:strand:+ start:21569 stop:22336 length:768 start_codon:yes stop_codon:yes gene_type:complete
MKKNFLTIKKLEDNINFGFFKSVGGVSKGTYASLNCSKSSKDNKNSINKNIIIAKNKLGIGKKKLKIINQIHSNKIFFINNKNYKNEYYGDGLVTKEKNIALAILTADCAPIFIFDIQKNFICCLHAGWKGALSEIIKKSIIKLKNKRIKSKNMVAVIGPCLGFKNFEVDKNFKLDFIKKDTSYMQFFKSKNKNKDLFNLRSLINFQLKKAGMKNVYNINRDTYKNGHIFFSHRRSSHQNKIKTGRMINIISFRD